MQLAQQASMYRMQKTLGKSAQIMGYDESARQIAATQSSHDGNVS
jgi:hypothetical protein